MGVIDSAELPAGWSHLRYVLEVASRQRSHRSYPAAAGHPPSGARSSTRVGSGVMPACVADGSADLRHAPAAVSNLIECLGAKREV